MTCCIVKRKTTFSSLLPLIMLSLICVALAIASAFIFKYMPIFILLAGLGIILYLAPSFFKTEYEYNIEGDAFSVAIIKNKSSRKEIFSCDMEHLVSCCPKDKANISPSVNLIKAHTDETSSYCALFTKEEKMVAVTFSPDEEFMKSMRLLAPLKVQLI